MSRHRREMSIVFAMLMLAAIPAGAQWTPCRQFGVREGLAQSQVTGITQDRDGFLWIATQGGISRFDGRRFDLFTTAQGLPDNVVTSIASNGETVWAGTDIGQLAVWKGVRFSSSGYLVPGLMTPIRTIAVRTDGTLLVGTEKGLYGGRPGAFRKLLPEPVNNLRRLGDGSILVLGRRVYRIPRGGVPERLTLPPVPGAAVGVAREDGTTWIAMDSGYLLRETPAGIQPTHLPPQLGTVTDLARDPQGGLLIATERGLWKRQPGGKIRSIQISLRAHSIRVRRLFVDRESNLWIGTFGEGLIQRPPSPFTQFTLDTGFPSTMAWSFTEDTTGCIEIGTSSAGVVSRCGDHWGPTLDVRSGLPSNQVLTLARAPSGGLWIGTRDGLCRWANGRCTNWSVRDGLPSNDIRGIAFDPKGGVWLATAGGLAYWDGGRWHAYTHFAGLRSPLMRSIVSDPKGNVWATVNGNGIVHYDGKRFEHLGLEAGLPTLRVWTLMLGPGGSLWASTDEGVWIRSPDGSSSRVIVKGLPSPIVVFLVLDEEGMVWAGTTRGVARISPQGEVVQRFTAEDGLTDSEAAEGAAFRDSMGRLWFGMAYGVTRVDTRLLLRNEVPPIPVLERFLVNGALAPGFHPISAVTRGHLPPRVLGPAPVDLRFDFSAPSLTAPAETRFRFYLEGFDPSPTGPVSEGYVSYHSVPAGHYRFVLEAANNDGVWSARPLNLDISVLPPWYATFWFRSLVLLLVVGATFLAIRIRFRAQERRQRRLEEEVRQRTKELAEANFRIQEQNELLKKLSRTDPLTGLGNRRVLAEHLPLELAVLRREVGRQSQASLDAYHGAMLCLVDLDHFKRVNDRWGHEVGDRALQAVAETLGPILREGDLAVRWGGEEFVILSRGVDTAGAIRFAQRLLEHLGRTTIGAPDGTEIRLPASIGFIQLPLGTEGFVESTLWAAFVDAADRLLYVAKARGRFRACGVVWEYGSTAPVVEEQLVARILEKPDEPPAPLRFIDLEVSARPKEA